MDPTTVLPEARSALETAARRTAELIRSLSDLNVPIPGSAWTVREAAAHLVNSAGVHRDIAEGTPSPFESLAPEAVAVANAGRLADIPEGDPHKLAGLLTEAVAEFLEATAHRSGHDGVAFHAGLPVDLAALTCISLGELLLHGYDIATAAGAPWPIASHDAEFVLYGYRTYLGGLVRPEAVRGLTARYALELVGGSSFVVRIVDGQYRTEPVASEPADCTITADPAAFLLAVSGRITQWEAIALGTFRAEGSRPDLALSFMNLFAYP
jgi:uncharacterized protein (TIGR03083 family)